MRHSFLILFVIFTNAFSVAFGQYKHQFSIISDNDSYLSINNDGYYSNGLKVSYQWCHNRPEREKTERVNNIYISHQIYNARFSGDPKVKNIDRPITGYLSGGFQQSLYNEKENLLQWGISVGAIGPPAYGEQIQKLAHKNIRIYPPTHWDRQLNGAWGVNAEMGWSPQITKEPASKWNFKPLITATAGSLFTNAGIGGAVVYGWVNKNSRSVFWNNHQEASKVERELFVYLHPMIYFKAYDATVQGGIFNKEAEKVPGALNAVFFKASLGAMYARKKIFFGASAIYESKQSLTQFSPQCYGSIQVGWMW